MGRVASILQGMKGVIELNVTFDDVYEKLLDLDSPRNNDAQAAGEAYHIRRGNPTHGSNNKCIKNDEYAKSHTHKDCQKLKAFRVKEKSAASGNVNIMSCPAFHTKLDLSWIPDLSDLPKLEEVDAFTMSVSFDFTTFSDISDVTMEDYFGFVGELSTSDNKVWIFDPVTTNHMTGTQVTTPSPYSGTVSVSSHRKLKITGIGNVTNNGSHGPITLRNVFLIPELANTNLISLSCIIEMAFTTTGTENVVTIYKPNILVFTFLKPRNLAHTSLSQPDSMTSTNDSDISPLPHSYDYATWSPTQNLSPQQVTWKHGTDVNSPNPPNHTSLLLPNHDRDNHLN
ncbi:uncharacterized protein H6S33_008267 [Morchella sextelata]|uniref:uncharacterized protein n=1 Tax=Morchella sextelata TaxID=1174677 RepID=UPI001D0459A7|nr:uncharacterized protein H6S33_008267 [Morchella sextelata]KAH0603263.1 hypothetical protein H6S33_008267 [Morchella sextelata]